MSTVVDEVRWKIRSGSSLSTIVGFLREREGFNPTPFNVLRVLHEATGLTVPKLQRIAALFDAGLQPLASTEEIDQTGEALLSDARGGSGRWIEPTGPPDGTRA